MPRTREARPARGGGHPPSVSVATRGERGARSGRVSSDRGRGELLVAVVHTPDRVRLVAVSSDREELVRELADYVRRRGPNELWPDDAARLGALLDGGDAEAAIAHYFATVGQRWDAEWLVITSVGGRPLAGGDAGGA